MSAFASTLTVTAQTTVLDVGGTSSNWHLLETRPQVTLANMPRAHEDDWSEFRCIFADGCRLPFRDREFDIVFSNSVIEHVGSWERQREFASEIRRVGKSYWVQTPDPVFPVEPHLVTPFLHYLPPHMQRALASRWTLWDTIAKPEPDRREWYIEHFLNDIRLISASEMAALFPDGKLIRERFLGLPRSIVTVRSL